MTLSKRVVVALGGNAILQSKEKGSSEEQFNNVEKTCRQIAGMIKKGFEVVITHGNGPQVGNILIQNERARDIVPAMPLDVCGAESQGQIGYMIQQRLDNLFKEMGISYSVTTIITQVLVDEEDPAFTYPTKPIGPFYTEKEAKEFMKKNKEKWIEDSGRGWRKVVPSPEPIEIIEKEAIKALLEKNIIVIASGGGGIPVIKKDGGVLQGVEAVIDKDLAGERLAFDVKADIFMMLTDVPKVAINFGKPYQKDLDRMNLSQAKTHLEEGHFPSGSMGPKVKAAIKFVELGGRCAIICSLRQALDALEGKAGTWIIA